MRMQQWEGRRRFREDKLARTVRGCFAQNDQSVANAAGSVVRADINANLQALVTNSSGASAPSTTWAYQFWADTTNGLMKQRNAANSAWITLYKLADNTTYVPAGSASAPGLAIAGDNNTGWWSPGADTLAASTGGTERVRVDSAGNVGLGVTPSAWSASWKSADISSSCIAAAGTQVNVASNAYTDGVNWVYKTSNWASMYEQYLAVHKWYSAASGTAGNSISWGDPKMTIDNGNLLVGATSQPWGGANGRIVGYATSGYAQVLYNTAAGPGGIAIVYSQSPNGTSDNFIYGEDGTTTRFYIRSNGGISNYQANDTNLSDERVKTDFQPAPSYYDRWRDIEFVTYLYKDQTDSFRNLGVKAQQLETVAPEFVDNSGFGETPEDGIPLKTVWQTDFQYGTAKALQETIEKLETLKAEFDAYKAAHP